MSDTFGARMRQHRETRDVSLETVARQTKISASLLEGLERDDLSRWPAGIYRKAYVRSYAQAIGLDPDITAREFLAIHPEPVEVIEPAPEPPTRLRSLLGSFGRRRSAQTAGSSAADDMPAPAPMAVQLPPRRPPWGRVPAPTESAPEPQPATITTMTPPAPAPPPAPSPVAAASPADLLAAAELCTELGRAENGGQIATLLKEAAKILDARGLIVWVWDGLASELKPAVVHGYPDAVRSHLPPVKADADNATAAAFRSARTCAVNGVEHASAALAVPLLTPAACAGVLAIELPPGSEEMPSVRAIATFIAAMLARLIGG
jgi:transcriptional regulator with XRE-family HTH domain